MKTLEILCTILLAAPVLIFAAFAAAAPFVCRDPDYGPEYRAAKLRHEQELERLRSAHRAAKLDAKIAELRRQIEPPEENPT